MALNLSLIRLISGTEQCSLGFATREVVILLPMRRIGY